MATTRAAPARDTTRFDKPFRGLGGRKPIATLRLFRRLDFMAPGKEFCQLVDPLALYLERREPARLTATVAYRDREGARFEGPSLNARGNDVALETIELTHEGLRLEA